MIRLQQLRLDNDLTVSSLAEQAKVARKTIVRLEEGARTGHPDSLRAIADVFGVQPSELLAPAVFPTGREAA